MERIVYNTNTKEVITILLPTESVSGPENIKIFEGSLEDFLELNKDYNYPIDNYNPDEDYLLEY